MNTGLSSRRHSRSLALVGIKVTVDYGFPWDRNKGLLDLGATTPASILRQTLWLLILLFCFGPEDRLHNQSLWIILYM